MPKLTIIRGFPGSGKSHRLNFLKSKGEIAHAVHDYYEFSPKLPGPEPHKSKSHDNVMTWLSHGKHVAVADVMFVINHEIEKFASYWINKFPDIEIKVVAFTNDADRCKQNIKDRMLSKGSFDEVEYQGFCTFIDVVGVGYDPYEHGAEVFYSYDPAHYQ